MDVHLIANIVGHIVGKLLEQRVQHSRLRKGQALDVGVVLAGTALHYVRCQRERRPHKPANKQHKPSVL